MNPMDPEEEESYGLSPVRIWIGVAMFAGIVMGIYWLIHSNHPEVRALKLNADVVSGTPPLLVT